MGLDSAEIDRRVRRAAEFVGLSEEHLKNLRSIFRAAKNAAPQ